MTFSKKYNKYISSNDYAYLKELMSFTPISEETRKKMSDAKKGNKNPNKNGLSASHKEKIRISNIGWKHKQETILHFKNIKKQPRPNTRNKYKITSPTGQEFIIITYKKLYEFISDNKLSQRKILSAINKGIITELNFKFLTKQSKKTLGWKIETI